MSTEREAFERWFSDEGASPNAVERDLSGSYKLMQAASAWNVWQARAALVQVPSGEALTALLLRWKSAAREASLRNDMENAQWDCACASTLTDCARDLAAAIASPGRAHPLTYPQARAAFEAWANKAYYDPTDGELRDAFLAGIEFIEGPEEEA